MILPITITNRLAVTKDEVWRAAYDPKTNKNNDARKLALTAETVACNLRDIWIAETAIWLRRQDEEEGYQQDFSPATLARNYERILHALYTYQHAWAENFDSPYGDEELDAEIASTMLALMHWCKLVDARQVGCLQDDFTPGAAQDWLDTNITVQTGLFSFV